MRRFLALLPMLLLSASPSVAGEPQQPDISNLSGDEAPKGELVLLGEHDSRMTVPVALAGAGPYPFVVDTGAERTVISRELAGTLNLAPGRSVQVTSMTGRKSTDTVIIPSLTISALRESGQIEAPAYSSRALGAPGLLGIDTLAGHAVAIDFEKGEMRVQPSQRRLGRERVMPNEIVVTAKSVSGQLILTEAYFNGSRVKVLLDTGSTASVGNGAFLKRLNRNPELMRSIELTSVTGEKTQARATLVPEVKVGGVTFANLPIAFSDVAPFKRLGLDRRPALILGMDALRAFRQVRIDFANREVRFLMPREAMLSRVAERALGH